MHARPQLVFSDGNLPRQLTGKYIIGFGEKCPTRFKSIDCKEISQWV
jgi:hypothetical protein